MGHGPAFIVENRGKTQKSMVLLAGGSAAKIFDKCPLYG